MATLAAHELREIREALGKRWGAGRPLTYAEFGMILRMTGRDPGRHPSRWELGYSSPRGPTCLAIELMLDGAVPRGLNRILKL